MVKVICIDDSNKPKEIPIDKWVKKDTEYTVIYTVTVLPQKQLAFHLAEIELDDSCLPYEYFLSKRFGIRLEDLDKLIQLIKDCNNTDVNFEELVEDLELVN